MKFLLFILLFGFYSINAYLPKFKIIEEIDFFPEEGSLFTLICPILLEVDLHVEWYKDDLLINQNSINLTISKISRIHSGNYRCYAFTEIGGAFSQEFNVTVSYFDGFAETPDSFFNVILTSSRFLVLSVPKLISRVSLVKWKWYWEDQEINSDEANYIAHNGDLVILNLQNRVGNYRLEAFTDKKSDRKNYVVTNDEKILPSQSVFNIIYKPRDISIISNSKFTHPTVFECVPMQWGKFQIEIKWYYNNEEIVENKQIKMAFFNRRLIISNIMDLVGKGTHQAVIKCVVKTLDDLIHDYSEARLDLFEPPKIDRENVRKEISNKIGDYAELTCPVYRAWPSAKMFWYFNNNKISEVNSPIFRLTNIKPKDYGIYQCEAKNIAGTDIAQIWLKNAEKSNFHNFSIIETPINSIVKTGNNIVLSCKTSDLENTKIMWLFNEDTSLLFLPQLTIKYCILGEELNEANVRLFRNSTSLIIHSSRKSDSGKYVCQAKSLINENLLQEAVAKVNVLGEKLIEYGPSNVSMLIGSNVQMPCKMAEDYSNRQDVSLNWFRNNYQIPEFGDMQRRISINTDGSLAINQVGPDNIGIYKCVVQTTQGEMEDAAAWLRIIEKPSMPQNVRVEIINKTLPAKIRVEWEPGFDGNSPIIKYLVEVRTLDTSGLWTNWGIAEDNVPAEKCCSTLIENLKPSMIANFRVASQNFFGVGRFSLPSQNITLPQQPPASAPVDVAASARSSSSVMVQWQPPKSEQWNGDILGYMIRYRLSGYASAEWNQKNVSNEHARNALIEPLITWREYDIQVAAYNDRGMGIYSTPIIVTTLEGVPMQAPQNIQVNVINSTDIQVSFDPPEQQMIPGVNLGYKIELWKNISQPPFRIVRVFPEFSRITEQIGNLEKFGHYNLTILCFTGPGEGPRSDFLEFVTMEDLPGPVLSISFDQVMFSSVLVRWEPPQEPNGIILKYIIRHWKINAHNQTKHKIEVSADENFFEIDKLSPSTKYMVDIQAVNKIGVGSKIEASFESGVTPELPGKPLSVTVTDIGARSAIIHFIAGFDGHAYIRKWIVEAKIGSSNIFSTIYNISYLKEQFFTVKGLRPFTKYQFRLLAENVRGRGGPSDPTRIFQTLQTYPEKPPKKLYAESISAEKILFSWVPIIPSYWNGEPVGYSILYKPIKQENSSLILKDDSNWNELLHSHLKLNELILDNLQPFNSYKIKMRAINSFGNGNFSEDVIATTFESVPIDSPINLKAKALDKQSIQVTWEEMDSNKTNGKILGYTVYLTPELVKLRNLFSKKHEIIGFESRLAQIKDLRIFTEYRISISAFTLVGEGPQNKDYILVRTDGDVPGKAFNVSFSYKSNSEVRLKWSQPVNPNGQISGYSIRYWRYDQLESDAVNTQIPNSINIFSATSLTPDVTYFFAIKAQNEIGEGEEQRLEVLTNSYNAPLPIPNMPFQNLSRAQSSDTIYLSWKSNNNKQKQSNNENLKYNVAPIRQIEVEYQMANENQWLKLDDLIIPDESELIINRLHPNTAYRVRIRFIGDFLTSSYSPESDWIKTLEASPSEPPKLMHVGPYETSSMLIQWATLDRKYWNSNIIGYKIIFRVYSLTNDSYRIEEISFGEDQLKEIFSEYFFKYVLKKLLSFHYYVVQIVAFNLIGSSRPSKPAFVYIGYSKPKQNIKNLIAESPTSTSIKLNWDKWEKNESDIISGYRVYYVPLIITFLPELQIYVNYDQSMKEIIVTETNELLIFDLRKFTEYEVSICGYNRAGEGPDTIIRIRTLEDIPEPIDQLDFQDILLDSFNVSWLPPRQPNGIVLNYLVNYRTYNLIDEFRKEIQEKTQKNYFVAKNLEEDVTYFVSVKVENSVGLSAETIANVTMGYNKGAPENPSNLLLIPEQSTFLLKWNDNEPGYYPIKGYLIQAKRIGTSLNKIEKLTNRKQREIAPNEFQTKHIIGQWFTIANIIDTDNKYRISYRLLEPASYYVFRVFARNFIGIGKASLTSQQLHVPEFIPEDPFYTKWWFLVIVGLCSLIIIMIFVATLCFTNNSYKSDKNHAFNTLQLADGGIVSYELHSKHLKRDELSRPNTHTSWVSTGPPVKANKNDVGAPGIYGSIGSGINGSAPITSMYQGKDSVYQALATDVISIGNQSDSRFIKRNIFNSPEGSYYSRNHLNFSGIVNGRNSVQLKNFDAMNGFKNNLSEYGCPKEFGQEHSDLEESENESVEKAFSSHYQSTYDEANRATWRKTRQQAEKQQQLKLSSINNYDVNNSMASDYSQLTQKFGCKNGGSKSIYLSTQPSQENGVENSQTMTTNLNESNGFSSFV